MTATETDAIASTLAHLRHNGDFPCTSTKALYDAARKAGFTYKTAKETFMIPKAQHGRGEWNVSSFETAEVKATDPAKMDPVAAPKAEAPKSNVINLAASVGTISTDEIFVPPVDPNYVAWGEFDTIKKVINSESFFPMYVGGPSGTGKTLMIEQACAKAKREYIRVQISPETDEDDLIGGFRLIGGETVFQYGPVLKAMMSGAILLIDELDRGTNKIMCLQGVLEGKPVLVKKIGEVISPKAGFNVLATANTMGRGSDDGRYTAAQVIDDAFLERFIATIEQPHPAYATELKIVQKKLQSLDVIDEGFAEKLVAWSTVIRKSYADDAVDEEISTRRLCHIATAHSIFNDRLAAIKMCISRFDEDTKTAFLDLYTKVDAESTKKATVPSATKDDGEKEYPF